MTEWREVTLGEVATKIGSGATPRGGKEAYRAAGIALIRSMNVFDDGFKFDGLAYIDDEQASKLKHVEVERGDVLVNITGASVARCCMAPLSVLPARVNQHVAIIRLRREEANPRFVSAYLTSPEGKGRLLNLASAGATREALTKGMLERFTIRLPDLGAQDRVAAVLESLDNLIEKNGRRAHVLERMAQAIYREWFAYFRYPGHESIPLADSSLGPIPANFEVAIAGDLQKRGVLEIGDGYRAKNSEMSSGRQGLPFIRVANVRDGHLALEGADELPASYVDRLRSKVSSVGDVVISMKGTVGRQAAVEDWHPRMAYSPQVSFWRSLMPDVVSPTYLYEWIRSEEFARQCSAVKGATDMADYVNLTDQRRMQVIIPPAPIMAAFTSACSPVRQLIGQLRAQTLGLARLRHLLLPRLVSGEVDVSDLDLDALTGAAVA